MTKVGCSRIVVLAYSVTVCASCKQFLILKYLLLLGDQGFPGPRGGPGGKGYPGKQYMSTHEEPVLPDILYY